MDLDVPADLAERLRDWLADHPTATWDDAIEEIAAEVEQSKPEDDPSAAE